MPVSPIRPGRPRGSRTADPILAAAFGIALRAERTKRGIAQESLANLAQVERSHVGKIERGEHMPTLAAAFKLAAALGMSGAQLVAEAEALLPAKHFAPEQS